MNLIVTISEARADLPKLIDAAEAGQRITITRHGKPVAVVMGMEAARSQRTAQAWAGAARIHQMLEDAKGKPLFSGPGISPEYADELVASIRADRDDED